MEDILARIRSIKPEFWTDGKNMALSDSCALFFIALWNFCDDEGKHPYNLDELVAELGGRWHRGKVKLFVSCLIKSGQLRINSTSTWIQVAGWSHQKIDKPKQPKVKASELQWLTNDDSTIGSDESRPFDARIGSDRRDRIGSDHTREKEVSPKAPKKKKEQPPANLFEVAPLGNIVSVYCDVWKSRYAVSPIIQPKDAGRLNKFAKSVGFAKAEQIIGAYLDMPDQWFLTKRHDVDTMLGNLNAIALFMETGKVVSRKEIQNADSTLRFKNLITDIEENGI